jgi:hypothetical protein
VGFFQSRAQRREVEEVSRVSDRDETYSAIGTSRTIRVRSVWRILNDLTALSRVIRSLFESQQHSLVVITESQQHSVASITESLQQLSMNSVSRTARTSSETLQVAREDHFADLQIEAQVVACAVPVPRLRPRFTDMISEVLHNPTSLCHIEQESSPRPKTLNYDHETRTRQLSSCCGKTVKFRWHVRYGSISYSLTKTPFGDIHVCSRIWRERRVDDENTDLRVMETPYYAETTITMFPALWLMRLGMKTGLDVMIYTSSLGWKNSLEIKPFRVVPDDSLIFTFCKWGNIDGIWTLLARGDSTVWDRDPDSWTPLHVRSLVSYGSYTSCLLSLTLFDCCTKLYGR